MPLLEQERRAYENALSKGECDVGYTRVMLLGPAGVGKSSLKRGLMNFKFDRKTNSTIVADVQSVRPVEYNWASAVSGSEEWKDVTPDDELNELAQLIVRVHKTQGSVDTHSKHTPVSYTHLTLPTKA